MPKPIWVKHTGNWAITRSPSKITSPPYKWILTKSSPALAWECLRKKMVIWRMRQPSMRALCPLNQAMSVVCCWPKRCKRPAIRRKVNGHTAEGQRPYERAKQISPDLKQAQRTVASLLAN
jgi:hypothetical protein